MNSTKVYEKHFETEFLRQTTGFYREEAQRFLAANTCPEYLFKAEARIEQERQRVADYLSSTSGIKLAKIVDRELVFTHAKALVQVPALPQLATQQKGHTALLTLSPLSLRLQMSNSGLVPMLRDNKLDDLNRMYRLFHAPEHVELVKTSMAQYDMLLLLLLPASSLHIHSPINRLYLTSPPLRSRAGLSLVLLPCSGTTYRHVTAEGEALVTDSERAKSPVEFVQRLLDMREKYDIIVREAFHSDKGFNRALKNVRVGPHLCVALVEAPQLTTACLVTLLAPLGCAQSFEKFMNKDTRCAQFLSAYLNDLFCRGKGKTDEEVDSILDRIIVVFRYLQDKDIFESYYKTALQRRLLGKRSASDDWERSMIAKLKVRAGRRLG